MDVLIPWESFSVTQQEVTRDDTRLKSISIYRSFYSNFLSLLSSVLSRSVLAMTSVRQLFGGAITAELPTGLVDASCVVSLRKFGPFD